MVKHILIVIVVLLSLPQLSLAQVATESLNAASSGFTSMAWREKQVVAVGGTNEGSNIQDPKVYNGTVSESGGVVAMELWNIAVLAESSTWKKEKTIASSDGTNPENYSYSESRSNYAIAMKIWDFLGYTVQIGEIKHTGNFTAATGTTWSTTNTSSLSYQYKEALFGYGGSLKAGVLHAGWGQIHHTRGAYSGDYSTVENDWTDTYTGIGILTGAVGSEQVRLDYYTIKSPASLRETNNSTIQSIHNESSIRNYAVGYKTSEGMFIQFEANIEAITSFDSSSSDSTTTRGTLEMGHSPKSGLVVTFLASRFVTSSSSNSLKESGDSFGANFGWVF